jgi:hypothetical protein
MKTRLLTVVLICMVFVLLAGCAPKATSSISIDGTWGRPSPTLPTSGAFYMTIKNTGNAPDKLLSGTSSACGSIEVHEMVKKSDGTMGMNLVDKPVEIPAGGQVELKVGGLHVMCIMKNDEKFVVGSTVDVTLTFEKAGEKTISADIRAE